MPTHPTKLGGRSREVLDVIFRRGEVSVADILEEVPDLPSYSAARSILRALGDKGLIRHRSVGPKYLYSPAVPLQEASRTALSRVLDTFFGGSPGQAVKALLELSNNEDYEVDLDEIEALIDQARREGR